MADLTGRDADETKPDIATWGTGNVLETGEGTTKVDLDDKADTSGDTFTGGIESPSYVSNSLNDRIDETGVLNQKRHSFGGLVGDFEVGDKVVFRWEHRGGVATRLSFFGELRFVNNVGGSNNPMSGHFTVAFQRASDASSVEGENVHIISGNRFTSSEIETRHFDGGFEIVITENSNNSRTDNRHLVMVDFICRATEFEYKGVSIEPA